MNDVLKAIYARRSVRRFTSEPVTHEQVEAILEAGRWAPSGKNTQPWRFVVVESCDKREELAALAPQAGMIAAAPVTLAVLLDGSAGYDTLKDAQGVGAAIENILLAVHALGLGACWMGRTRDAAIEAVLGAKQEESLMALIPIGHPVKQPDAGPRHPLESITRFV